MILDGMGGQFQAPRDLLDGMSLQEKVQHVELPGVNSCQAAMAGSS